MNRNKLLVVFAGSIFLIFGLFLFFAKDASAYCCKKDYWCDACDPPGWKQRESCNDGGGCPSDDGWYEVGCPDSNECGSCGSTKQYCDGVLTCDPCDAVKRTVGGSISSSADGSGIGGIKVFINDNRGGSWQTVSDPSGNFSLADQIVSTYDYSVRPDASFLPLNFQPPPKSINNYDSWMHESCNAGVWMNQPLGSASYECQTGDYENPHRNGGCKTNCNFVLDPVPTLTPTITPTKTLTPTKKPTLTPTNVPPTGVFPSPTFPVVTFPPTNPPSVTPAFCQVSYVFASDDFYDQIDVRYTVANGSQADGIFLYVNAEINPFAMRSPAVSGNVVHQPVPTCTTNKYTVCCAKDLGGANYSVYGCAKDLGSTICTSSPTPSKKPEFPTNTPFPTVTPTVTPTNMPTSTPMPGCPDSQRTCTINSFKVSNGTYPDKIVLEWDVAYPGPGWTIHVGHNDSMGPFKYDWWWAPAWSGSLATSTETPVSPCMDDPQFYNLECFYGADQCGSMTLPGKTSCPITPTSTPTLPPAGFYYCPI